MIGDVLDDQLAQNQARALGIVSSDSAFGSFQATLVASGWGDLDAAGVPTWTWGIQAAEAANRPQRAERPTRSCAASTALADGGRGDRAACRFR